MWVSPKRRERGKGVWGVRPFLQEDRGSFAKRSHDDTYYIFDKSVISNNYYLCSARVSFNSPLVVEERPLLQAQVNYLGFFENSTFASREQLVGSLPYVIERYKGKH